MDYAVHHVFVVNTFCLSQAWVKQKRLQTQRQLLLLQNNLRDKLVEIESDADDQTINAILMMASTVRINHLISVSELLPQIHVQNDESTLLGRKRSRSQFFQ